MNILTSVCVAIDERYNENNGSYTVFYLWDGKKVTTDGGMYSDLSFNHHTVNATAEQIKEASRWMLDNTEESYSYNKYCYNRLGANTYIGCVVKLARSRKAPNNTELKVIDFHESYYDRHYNNHVSEQITVTDGCSSWTVSSGCIKTVVKGTKEKPFWYVE